MCHQVPSSGSPGTLVTRDSDYVLNYVSAVLFCVLGIIGTLFFQKLWKCCRTTFRRREEPDDETSEEPTDHPVMADPAELVHPLAADPAAAAVAARPARLSGRPAPGGLHRRVVATSLTQEQPSPNRDWVQPPTLVPIFPRHVYVTLKGDCYHAEVCPSTVHSVGIKKLEVCSKCKSGHDNTTTSLQCHQH